MAIPRAGSSEAFYRIRPGLFEGRSRRLKSPKHVPPPKIIIMKCVVTTSFYDLVTSLYMYEVKAEDYS